jgi:membrane protease subunit HflK
MSQNDPQWGKKGNGGPPDLDELWRNWNQKLNGLFGRKNGGGHNNDNLKQYGGGIGLLIIVILIIWIFSGFYIVDASERGVVLRFGKYQETTQPGLRWRLPYPMESKEIVNVSHVRTVEIGYRGKAKELSESLMLTDDLNIIDIQFAVQYILKSPEDYLFSNRTPDETVYQVAETAMREVVGKNRMDFLLYEGREQVAAQATKLMQSILDRYKTGIQISEVKMQNTQPPEQVQAAFDDAVKSKQDYEKQKNEGQAYANDVIPKARGTGARLLEEANGYKQRVIANADGEANRFKQILVEYNRAPAVTRDRLYLDTMQQVLSNTSKVVIDQKSGSNLLYLPLDKLIQLSGSQSPVTGDSSSTTANKILPSDTASVPEINTRSRDPRSREREQR